MLTSTLRHCISIDDLREAARARLPRMLFDFADGGSGDEASLRANSAAYDDYALLGRPLVDVSRRDTRVDLFGRTYQWPLFVAPTGSSGLLWPRGEAEVARACGEMNIGMIVSAGATLSIEEIGEAGTGPKWLQLFLYRDRGITREFAERAKAAGYEALCLTVDCPLLGLRERDVRNGFTINPRLSLSNIIDACIHPRWWMRMTRTPRVSFRNFAQHGGGNIVNMAQYISSLIDPSVQWKDVEWLRTIWHGPLLIKGILREADARHAADIGCDGILVSNHGGRQLDHTIATLEALPQIATAVGHRIPVMVDGGIRRGTDIIKALALGASAVAIGRAHLWGLAVGGRAGVKRALEILQSELDLTMAIGGWPNLASLDRDAVRSVRRVR